MRSSLLCMWFFFFNDTATTEIYTLSLHDALPISGRLETGRDPVEDVPAHLLRRPAANPRPGRAGQPVHRGEGAGPRRRSHVAAGVRPPRPSTAPRRRGRVPDRGVRG